MSTEIKGISSMATRLVLAELVQAFQNQTGQSVQLEAVGGVDAAKRVQSGEAFDVVILASDAMDKLLASGHLLVGSKVDLVHSSVAMAVPKGAAVPDISTEEAVKQAVLAAQRVCYSTGPSGTALLQLFERWGVSEQLTGHLFQAPAGIPVGSWVAKGEADLGFQQLSELISLEGVTVLQPLPESIQITTTFSAAVAQTSQQAALVKDLIAFLASPAADAAKRRQGMEPA
jgi:molybdate transport system substrate-binding protein